MGWASSYEGAVSAAKVQGRSSYGRHRNMKVIGEDGGKRRGARPWRGQDKRFGLIFSLPLRGHPGTLAGHGVPYEGPNAAEAVKVLRVP